MATRSNIAIYLNPEDLNKSFTLLDVIDKYSLDEDMISCSSSRTPNHEDWSDIFTEICADDVYPVFQIYCHHDGYPEGVGAELLRNFNSYEKALALVAAGDTSSIEDGHTQCYSLGKGDSYEHCKPRKKTHPTVDQEYLYVWRDGKWTIGTRGRSLESYLNGEEYDE